MSQRTETICDMCGARKGESNHWWIGWISFRGFHLYSADYDPDESGFSSTPECPVRDYCGERCVQKALSQFMSGPNLPPGHEVHLEDIRFERPIEDEMTDELDSMLKKIPILTDEEDLF